MIPEVVAGAFMDGELHDADKRVYGLALRELSFFEFRPFKRTYIARALGISRRSAQRALYTLTARSYLKRGPDNGQLRTYGLVHERRTDAPRETPVSPTKAA